MHLALNFQRVDPARGGAETYVADLCRNLVQAGHRVDLYAESWADGCLAPPRSTSIPVAATGTDPAGAASGASPETPRRPCARRSHDCSVGFINTWSHDVIIPQGGVQAGSLAANAQRFPPLVRPALLARQDGQSQVLGAPR